jgi:hypothetical protein
MDFFNRSVWSTYTLSDSIDQTLKNIIIPAIIRDNFFIDKRRDFNAALINLSKLFRDADEIERRFKPERDMIFILPTDVIKVYESKIIEILKSAKRADVQVTINSIFDKLDELELRIGNRGKKIDNVVLKSVNII